MTVIRKVVRYDRSPTNAKVWILQLECGHDFFRTARQGRMPKSVQCEKCQGDAPTR